ncbi:hypothetical protein CMK10_08650 [Candidatus Poribacteria bacterium]|jgi:nucleotide-binding universal stress UspA family protein|uniref:UspA domain-containing protein n=1 Tax=marine metagenome TaxID=408172 RepID=A0A382HNL7_9ZZZZ|nr:hypothetical protein [Candidatus Poribacteria bacterium]
MSQIVSSGPSFSKILLGLDGSDYTQSATQYACQIASKHQAEITGMAIIDMPGIGSFGGPAPIGAIHYSKEAEKQRIEKAQEKAVKILQSFEETCKSENVNYNIHADTGRPFEEIVDESKYHDFIVVGQQTFFQYNPDGEPDETLDKLLTLGMTPILAVPDYTRDINRILVAYDDSVQSARSIQMFLMLNIWNQCEITILNVNDDKDKGLQLLKKLEGYFTSYGVGTQDLCCIKGDPSSEIMSQIQELSIDLLVMGAYGRNDIVKFFFGSVTQQILEQANIPVLLYH